MPRIERPSRSTRRWLLVVSVVGAGMYLAGLVTTSAYDIGRAAFGRSQLGASGVFTLDRSRVDDGYVSIGVQGTKSVQLVAKSGEVVHTWHLGYGLNTMATMDADGSLLYLGGFPQPTDRPNPPVNGGPAGIIERITWDSTVEWSLQDPLINHDFAQLPDGTLAVIRWSDIPAAIANSIAGGIPGSEQDGRMWGNQIVEINPKTNQERVVFDIAQAWRPEDYPIPDFMLRNEWAHANSLFYTPSDPITLQEAYLISYRAVSTIQLVSRATGKVIWSYGGLWVLDQQHDATLLDNGDVLLFDDGQYLRGAPSASKVLEIDPRTNKVVWSYSGYGVVGTDFYSAITGGAQRLPNGDTLVTLGTKGQLMEITPDKTVVWDYRAGSDTPDPKYPAEPWNVLFKSRSFPASEVAPLLGRG